jgi:catechol 2,3-dioxygenase-like lactoylglutathione lyase family enzyme
VPVDLFAGIYVRDYDTACDWYTRLFGFDPFVVSDTEAVWELAARRSIVIEEHAGHAGHAIHTVFVDDLDGFVAEAAARGIEPVARQTYDNGVRKARYLDPDGNELGIGGAPERG